MGSRVPGTPADLVRHGCCAEDVCQRLQACLPRSRASHAVDALVTAVLCHRVDSFNVLLDIGTPLNRQGSLGMSVFDALLLHGFVMA